MHLLAVLSRSQEFCIAFGSALSTRLAAGRVVVHRAVTASYWTDKGGQCVATVHRLTLESGIRSKVWVLARGRYHCCIWRGLYLCVPLLCVFALLKIKMHLSLNLIYLKLLIYRDYQRGSKYFTPISIITLQNIWLEVTID